MHLGVDATERLPPQGNTKAWKAIGLGALAIAVLLLAQTVLAITAIQYRHVDGASSLSDFDAFFLAGRMALEGRAADAYDTTLFFDVQRLQFGNDGFLWAYPPQFSLIAAILALVSPWVAFLTFMEVTLAAYLLSLRALSRTHFPYLVLLMFPFLVVTIRSGQNGFLTGALLGWFLCSFQTSKGLSGLPLGLMVIKPHLAIGLGALTLISRRWTILVLAGLVVIGTSLVASVAFGQEIWRAFLNGVGSTGSHLDAGTFKFYRMVSLFAAIRSVGGSASLAFAAQAGLAVLALGTVTVTWARGWRTGRVLGLCGIASILISPYNHDYDLGIYGLSVALMAGDMFRVASRVELTLIFVLSWLLMGYGLGSALSVNFELLEHKPASISAVIAIVLFVVFASLMGRSEKLDASGISRRD